MTDKTLLTISKIFSLAKSMQQSDCKGSYYISNVLLHGFVKHRVLLWIYASLESTRFRTLFHLCRGTTTHLECAEIVNTFHKSLETTVTAAMLR